MNTETMPNVYNFLDTHAALEMRVERVPANPNMADDKWAKTARHWYYTIRKVGSGPCEPLTGYFSQGSAHKKPPTLGEVLDCLASDSTSLESFETWAADRCHKQAKALKAFLGADLFDTLVYHTERL